MRIAKDVLCAGAHAKVCLPDGPEEFARALARRGSRRPVVVGDDRALLRAVGLLHRERELAGVALSLVPVGAAAALALARALGVPTDAVAAARAVLDGASGGWICWWTTATAWCSAACGSPPAGGPGGRGRAHGRRGGLGRPPVAGPDAGPPARRPPRPPHCAPTAAGRGGRRDAGDLDRRSTVSVTSQDGDGGLADVAGGPTAGEPLTAGPSGDGLRGGLPLPGGPAGRRPVRTRTGRCWRGPGADPAGGRRVAGPGPGGPSAGAGRAHRGRRSWRCIPG